MADEEKVEYERNAKMLGLLVMNARLLQQMAACTRNEDKAGIGEHVLAFIDMAVGLYGDGFQLQADAHLLARQVGFVMSLVDASKEAHA